jgi:hypothetical protein
MPNGVITSEKLAKAIFNIGLQGYKKTILEIKIFYTVISNFLFAYL